MDSSNAQHDDHAALINSLLELSDVSDLFKLAPPLSKQTNFLLSEWVTPQSYIPTQNTPKPSRVRNYKLPDRQTASVCSNFGEFTTVHEKVTFRYIRDNGTYRRLKYEPEIHSNKSSLFKTSSTRTSIDDSIPIQRKTEAAEKHSVQKPEYSTLLDKANALYNVDNSRVLYMKKPSSTVNEFLIKHEINQAGQPQSSQIANKLKPVPVCHYRDKASTSAPQIRSSKQKSTSTTSSASENYISTSKLFHRLQETLQSNKMTENRSSIDKERTWHESLPTGIFNVSKLNSPQTSLNLKLKPIERITPAMRENYDNVYAKERLGELDESHLSVGRQPTFNDATMTQATQYRVSKLGEGREKSNSMPIMPPDFQSFLPSISGKGIGPISSTSTRY